MDPVKEEEAITNNRDSIKTYRGLSKCNKEATNLLHRSDGRPETQLEGSQRSL